MARHRPKVFHSVHTSHLPIDHHPMSKGVGHSLARRLISELESGNSSLEAIETHTSIAKADQTSAAADESYKEGARKGTNYGLESNGVCINQTGVYKSLPAAPQSPIKDLSESDIGNLNAILDHEVSRTTIANYDVQWRSFCMWAMVKGVQPLPADPVHVAAYLAERIEELGHRPATLRVAAAAIAFAHRTAGIEDPCAGPEVRRMLRSATRMAGRSQKQAEGLTAEALAAIRSTACKPRRGRGGRLESPQTARARGNLDVAMISLMRDAMLRVSEAAVLIWRDIASAADGTGRLLIRRSKTDAEGEGAVAFVSTATMAALCSIRNEASDDDTVFGLRPNQIAKRIKMAAQVAGLGDGFSGHSPRVGMARDLARAGIELPSLMTAGRWRTSRMPAHYIRNETAGKGAVAQFYGHHRPAP